MKKLLPVLGLLLCTYVNAQSTEALPQPVYNTMIKASTTAEITMLQGGTDNIIIEGQSIAMLEDFITEIGVKKPNAEPTATIVCMVHGSEIVTGTVYLSKVGGAVVFNINGVEYVNGLNNMGADFFRSTVAML